LTQTFRLSFECVRVSLMIDTSFQMAYLVKLFSLHFNAAISYHNGKKTLYDIMQSYIIILLFVIITFNRKKWQVFLFKKEEEITGY